jgi:hypothetical protein
VQACGGVRLARGGACWLGSDFLDFFFESCGVAMKGKKSNEVAVESLIEFLGLYFIHSTYHPNP